MDCWLASYSDFFKAFFFLHSIVYWIYCLCVVANAVVVYESSLLHGSEACKKNSRLEINVHENRFGHVERFALHN